jgi:hypothetical protein
MLLPHRPEDALGILDELRVVVVEAHAAPSLIEGSAGPWALGMPSTFIARTSFECGHGTAAVRAEPYDGFYMKQRPGRFGILPPVSD